MYDPRVVRGSTYRQKHVPAASQPDPLELHRQQEAARRKAARKRQQQKTRPRTPKAVDGRKHMDVQTELYLEELTDRVEETDISTQTDSFLDRPPSPLFIPPKTGVDVATQILEGELFDFDVEVKPLLEVLIGKTLEQAQMEVMEEEELDRLRDHQREFESLRAAEMAEVQRLEEQAARREEEKEKRLEEQRQAVLQQKSTAEKIAARAFAHSYLSELVPSVFSSLSDGGFFYDRQEREIESQFIPWLMSSVEENLSTTATSRLLLDDILRNVVNRSRPSGNVDADIGGIHLSVTTDESSTDPAPGDDGDGDDDDKNDKDGNDKKEESGKDAGAAGDEPQEDSTKSEDHEDNGADAENKGTDADAKDTSAAGDAAAGDAASEETPDKATHDDNLKPSEEESQQDEGHDAEQTNEETSTDTTAVVDTSVEPREIGLAEETHA